MNPQPTEQSVRPHCPLSDQHGAVLPTTPSRLLVFEERAPPNAAAPSRSTPPEAEHPAIVPGGRRISMVENVAMQILSGTIEFGAGERSGLVTGQGVGPRRWPLMLNRAEVCEYLGASWRTLKKTLTVSPVDMGANIVRYNRDHLDSWAASRPPMGPVTVSQDTSPVDKEPPVDTTAAALARARDRGCKR